MPRGNDTARHIWRLDISIYAVSSWYSQDPKIQDLFFPTDISSSSPDQFIDTQLRKLRGASIGRALPTVLLRGTTAVPGTRNTDIGGWQGEKKRSIYDTSKFDISIFTSKIFRYDIQH